MVAVMAQDTLALPCLLVRATMFMVDTTPLLLLLCVPRWRHHREAIMVARSIAAMVVSFGFVATAAMRQIVSRTFRQVVQHFWGLLVFRAFVMPLSQQLTLRTQLLAMSADTIRWGIMLWLLVPANVGAVQFVLALACSSVAAALLALVYEWHWRAVFVRHAFVSAAFTHGARP